MTDLTSPTTIEEMIYKKLGRPSWGDCRTTPGWKGFFEYAKLLDDRYSVFPFTLFDSKRKNQYFIRNVQALMENGLSQKVRAKRIDSLDSLQIIELFENNDDMPVPEKRSLNFCFQTELIGLSATSSETEKALNNELKLESKTKKTIELPPAKNAGNPASIDQLYEIMTSEMPL